MSADKMKGLLLRVGIDKGTGGCLAPIFPDRSFEYIPIPETCATSETNVYKNMMGERGRPLTDFVKKETYLYSHPHSDPEFETYTYGDPAPKKRKRLSELARGDMLIFYAGLKPEGGKPKDWASESRLFVIGYFTIEKVYNFKEISRAQWEETFNKVPNNAHSKIYNRLKALDVEYGDDNLIIVKGCREGSRLSPKAVPLGDDYDYPLEDVGDIIGYKKSLRRAVCHNIDENHLQKVRVWLEQSMQETTNQKY